MPFGLLYARGPITKRVDALFAMYDSNQDGMMFTTSMKKIIRDMIMISVIIVPALVNGKEIAEVEADL